MANYFSLFLVILTVGSGLIWLIDSLVFAPKRRERQAVIESSTGATSALNNEVKLPYIVDTAQQIFPVIAFVLVLRSFLYEPFQIPSGSMMPTLLVGDFILVEKYAYGLKDPVFRKKFVDTGAPERGDVVVFKYPEEPSIDYIKRVVGLPGDIIEYRNKALYIKPACDDGSDCEAIKPVKLTFQENETFKQNGSALERFSEQLGEVEHEILRNPAVPPIERLNLALLPKEFRYYTQPGTRINEWIVPEGQYFVLGDNRDNSRDSRYWGFVEDQHLVGQAVAIWISFEFERDPSSWLPNWVPTGIRFNRVGGIQ
ncbi:signal peptidase I [Aestuariibacter salexigens]|uniref:signal peptidase I n=1 Tax=Aestuariibacter salexigens TaxID=226010 RepID=UPI00041D421C|nr:signal peptidase I [Aestuariibacter salexigens]